MKVLVIGGCGFLGSNICKRFINRGDEVICLDNLSTGSKDKIWGIMYNPLFTFILHDITEFIPAANVDVIINCATSYGGDILHFYKMCTHGIFNIAGIARRNHAKIIHLMFNNNYKKYLSLSMANEILRTYQSMHDLDVKILNLHNVYGENMKLNNFFIADAIIKSLKSEALDSAYYNDVQLPMVYVEDALNIISYSADVNKKFEDNIEVTNSENIYSYKDILLKIFEITGNKVSCNITENIKNNYNLVIPNPIEKFWKPKISLEDGLKKTIIHIAEKLGIKLKNEKK